MKKMMNLKIVYKKRFLIFILFFLFIVLGAMYGANHFKNINRNDVPATEEINEISTGNAQADAENTETKKEEPKIVTEYENQMYKYGVKFPNDWFMNNDDSESKILKIDNGSNVSLLAGGQTFWSNYPDINKYNPQNKTQDFRLLSLTVYKDNSLTIDAFAQKINVKNFAEAQEIKGGNIFGQEYVGGGLTDNNPRITAIFKNDDLFYVFKPAFINGDENAADIMEGIVKSFVVE
jgi:hypothetical protein